MMEIFGATAGGISVAAVFNNRITCFEYIQLGRHFGEDFERCQLKLDVARCRLARRGQAVDIVNDPTFREGSTDDPTSSQACDILASILRHVELAREKAKRYEANQTHEALGVFGPDDMRPRPMSRRQEPQRWPTKARVVASSA
jgi:hypothetical protein